MLKYINGILLLLFISSCKNDNAVFNKVVEFKDFDRTVTKMFQQGLISCQQHMDYVDYPLIEKDVRNKTLTEIFEIIDLKSSEAFEKYTSQSDTISIRVSNEIQEKDNDIILNLSTLNKLQTSVRVSNIEIDVWTSKFNLLGTYSFAELENSIIPSGSEILNDLYIPKNIFEEDLMRSKLSLPSKDYSSCIRFKILSWRVDEI